MQKRIEKRTKNIYLGNSLCSKKILCEFCDFLKEDLRFFVATLWQHWSHLPRLDNCFDSLHSGLSHRDKRRHAVSYNFMHFVFAFPKKIGAPVNNPATGHSPKLVPGC